jgi:hypothetical protein
MCADGHYFFGIEPREQTVGQDDCLSVQRQQGDWRWQAHHPDFCEWLCAMNPSERLLDYRRTGVALA